MSHADGPLQATLDRGMALAFGTAGWAPVVALSALGVMHGVRGAPRDPRATAMAVGASSWLGSRGWGPAQ
eukprot:12733608-Alexandrium_andersonii.AAC.1